MRRQHVTTSGAVHVTVDNDARAPVIRGIGLERLHVTGATITWTTNESSTSQVEYGSTTAYGTDDAR